MPVTPALFGSRVAVRVFTSFVLAAILPLSIVAALVLTQVSWTLERQAQRTLDEASNAIGQQLLDRLLIADDVVRNLSVGSQISESIALAGVQLVDESRPTLIFGDAFTVPAFRDSDSARSNLLVQVSDQEYEIFLMHRTESGAIIGKVDEAYLWEASTLLPYAMELCVVDDVSRTFLHCTTELTDDAKQHVISNVLEPTPGDFSWSSDEGTVIASHWQLFLPSRFATTPWSIIVSQPEDVALEALSTFNRVFPTVVAVSLILTLLLAAIQIRRIMNPLSSLVSGTRRIANRDFSAPIELNGQNEFRQLAEAMNDMAVRLGSQFETITALAEIDRIILSSQSIREVLERILERSIAIAPDCCVSVLLIDPDKHDRAQLFSRLPNKKYESLHSRLELTRKTLTWLAGVGAGSAAAPGWIREQIPELPALRDANSSFVIPVFRADELRGAMIVQMSGDQRLDPHTHSRLAELAGRLAVAVSAADHESELFRRAHFDALTGLPNRQLCFDRLYQALAQARRDEHKLAVLFVDLDRFKNINDSHGHSLGDDLLREVALRLSASVRETDTVARLGGDEYVVILPHIDGVFEVETIVQKIVSLLERPFFFNDREVSISASIGVTIFPDDATDADSLLQKADTAMYAAKDTGRARIEFFEEEMDRSLKERLTMQEDLRDACRKGQFSLVYQAQLDLETGRLACMEALMRWHHPQRGAISPSVFIPVMEDMGIIGKVGRWVLETAITTFAGWRAEGLDLPRISVNVSGKQLVEDDLEAFLVELLRRHSFEGHNLEVELTEHCLIEDFEHTNDLLHRLSSHGIRVAVDDFGTGYSSLGYLHGLRFDALKIDRAFVQGLPSEKSVAIVEAVLAVARALDKEVIAEGIDAEHQRMKLVELGCRIGQGYLLSVPIPADEVMEWSARLDQTSVIEKLVAMHG